MTGDTERGRCRERAVRERGRQRLRWRPGDPDGEKGHGRGRAEVPPTAGASATAGWPVRTGGHPGPSEKACSTRYLKNEIVFSANCSK